MLFVSAVPSSIKPCPSRRGRGIAATGRVYHAVNSDGVVGQDFLTRVSSGGKRCTINLGRHEELASQLDHAVRSALREGTSLGEVRRMVAARLRSLNAAGHALWSHAGKAGTTVPSGSRSHAAQVSGSALPISPPPGTTLELPLRDSNRRILRANLSFADPEFSRTRCPAIRDLIRALEAQLNAALVDVKTLRSYIRSLLNAVELVLYYRAGCVFLKPNRKGRRIDLGDFGLATGDDFIPAVELAITFLDQSFAADFWRARRELAADHAKKKQASASVSTATEFRQLSALFTAPWALQAYDRAHLRLRPNLTDLVAYKPKQRPNPPLPFSPSPDLVRAAHQLMRQAAKDWNLVLCTALALALLAGLRHNEIKHARKSWLVKTAAGPAIEIRAEEDFQPKFRHERRVVIPRWLFDWLKHLPSKKYLVADSSLARLHALRDAVGALRRLGFACQKPLHAQRALFAAYRRKVDCTAQETIEALGHKSLATTRRYYAPEPIAAELVHLWRRPLPAPGPQPNQLCLAFEEHAS